MGMSFLITKLLGPAQEISSRGRSPVHVFRWTVFQSKLFEVCLDHCDGEVSNAEPCDYPNRFFSFGLAKARRAKHPQPTSSSCDLDVWMVLVGSQPVSADRGAA